MKPVHSLARNLLLAVGLLLVPAGISGASAQAAPHFSVDESFGSQGLVTGDIGPIQSSATLSPRILARDPQGRILVGAANGSEWEIWRILPDGGPDPTFGGTGKVIITSWAGYGGPTASVNLASAAVRPDGRILLAGYEGSYVVGNNVRKGQASMILKQLLPDGSPDLSFGHTDGGNWLSGGKGAVKVALQRDGGFLVGGFNQIQTTGRTDDGALFRFTSGGKIDKDFGPGKDLTAVSVLGAPGKASDVFDVDLLANGRILLSGVSKNRLWVMKLRANGLRDNSFGSGGQVFALPGGKKSTLWAAARDLEVDSHGRILIAGYATPKNTKTHAGYGVVMRLTSSGHRDKKFGSKGLVRVLATHQAGDRFTRLYDIQTDSHGGIWVTGSAGRSPRNSRHAITVRYLPNGKKDRRFFQNGVMKLHLGDGSMGTSLSRTGHQIYLAGRYDHGNEESFFLERLGSRLP